MSKYTGDFEYNGKLTRMKSDKVLNAAHYKYELNGRVWDIMSFPWRNRYGHWEARCGNIRVDDANNLWIVIANIDRRNLREEN
jgi:hypothetical protein